MTALHAALASTSAPPAQSLKARSTRLTPMYVWIAALVLTHARRALSARAHNSAVSTNRVTNVHLKPTAAEMHFFFTQY